MFYFLIILLPFAAVMIGLSMQSKKLREKYQKLVKRIARIAQQVPNQTLKIQTDFPKRGWAVSNDDIKKLELFVQIFETQRPKKRVFNSFEAKTQKLSQIEKRIAQIEKQKTAENAA